jgi:hypothetical protein
MCAFIKIIDKHVNTLLILFMDETFYDKTYSLKDLH